MVELLSISSLLEVAKRAKAYDSSKQNEEIKRCIISEDEVADDASPELFKIRKSIRGMSDRINAFAISSKLGLDDSVIEDAKGRLNTKDIEFEDVLSNLEASRITIEKEQLEIKQYKSQIETLKKQLENKHERLDSSCEKILREANEEALRIISLQRSFESEIRLRFSL